jgi:hypothetical protein
MLAPRRVGKTSLMLELKQAPRENWDVIPVDVEGGHGPEDCVAAILAKLAADPRYRTPIEAIPFLSAVKRVTAKAVGQDQDRLPSGRPHTGDRL